MELGSTKKGNEMDRIETHEELIEMIEIIKCDMYEDHPFYDEEMAIYDIAKGNEAEVQRLTDLLKLY